jgi:3-deoxy-manno-octulosonate cytidylyltransferase (CMP-KDO synthetase)
MEAWTDPGVVKVARRSDGAALYFSRAPIPWKRAGAPDADELASEMYLRHVGIYAFTRDALRRWTLLPACELEDIERLEQLRPLAAGLRIGVGIVPQAEGGIDTPEDVRRVEARLLSQGVRQNSTGR